jgi:hypothetical protein
MEQLYAPLLKVQKELTLVPWNTREKDEQHLGSAKYQTKLPSSRRTPIVKVFGRVIALHGMGSQLAS